LLAERVIVCCNSACCSASRCKTSVDRTSYRCMRGQPSLAVLTWSEFLILAKRCRIYCHSSSHCSTKAVTATCRNVASELVLCFVL